MYLSIINELITNSLEHGLDGNRGNVHLAVTDGSTIKLAFYR